MRYFDRLTDRACSDPGPAPWLGRWVLAIRSGASVVQNGIGAQDGDFLIPDRRGEFRVEVQGSPSSHGHLLKGQEPSPLDADSLHSIGARLQSLRAARGSWLEWLDVPPLVPGLSERATLQPIELDLADNLSALAHVCAHPHSHLKGDIERLPVHRVRRVPPRAIGHLAAHSEDWEYPTLCGVRPRRILGVVREEDLDLYENRVAARLIDHLAIYLLRRISEVETIRRTFQQVSDYSRTAAFGSHFRQRRVFKLWGRHADANEGLLHAQRTRIELDRLYRELCRLQASSLYRAVPRRAEVPLALRPSNLFAHDAMYRCVARLWLNWSKLSGSQRLSASQIYRRNQEMCRGFIDLVALLVVHAFDQLGYVPKDLDAHWGPSSVIELDSPWGAVLIRWTERDCLLVERPGEGGCLLRIIPALAQLGNQDPTADGWPDPSAVADYPTLIACLRPSTDLYEGKQGDGLPSWISGLPGDNASNWGVVPIAPWDLGAVERIARALRSVLLPQLFHKLPPRIKATHEEVASLLGIAEAVRAEADNKACYLKRSLRQSETVGLQRLIDECTKVRDELADKVEDAGAIQSASKDYRRSLGEANRQKSLRRHELNEAEQRLQKLTSYVHDITRGQQMIEQALRCPVCPSGQERGTGRIEVNSDGTFRATCQECSTTWDTRQCACCQRRFATLWPKLTVTLATDRRGWLDDQIGCDVLAVPCTRQELTKPVFHCPHCGGCTACNNKTEVRNR